MPIGLYRLEISYPFLKLRRSPRRRSALTPSPTACSIRSRHLRQPAQQPWGPRCPYNSKFGCVALLVQPAQLYEEPSSALLSAL